MIGKTSHHTRQKRHQDRRSARSPPVSKHFQLSISPRPTPGLIRTGHLRYKYDTQKIIENHIPLYSVYRYIPFTVSHPFPICCAELLPSSAAKMALTPIVAARPKQVTAQGRKPRMAEKYPTRLPEKHIGTSSAPGEITASKCLELFG